MGELAESEVSSTGERYGDIPTDKLGFMANSLQKALAKNGLTPDDRAEKQRKQAAIGVILAHRNLDATQ